MNLFVKCAGSMIIVLWFAYKAIQTHNEVGKMELAHQIVMIFLWVMVVCLEVYRKEYEQWYRKTCQNMDDSNKIEVVTIV